MSTQRTGALQHRCFSCLLCNREQNLSIKSDSSNLYLIRDQIKMVGEYCNLDDREVFDLQVAVGEASANAIEHGSPNGAENYVHFAAACDGSYLTITIRDEGEFIRKMPDPDTDGEINFRGRGIPLMLALMDRVTIDEASTGTCVVLMKKVAGR